MAADAYKGQPLAEMGLGRLVSYNDRPQTNTLLAMGQKGLSVQCTHDNSLCSLFAMEAGAMSGPAPAETVSAQMNAAPVGPAASGPDKAKYG